MRIRIFFFLALFMAAFVAQSQTPPNTGARQWRQRSLIERGPHKGQFKRPEARKLHKHKQQRHIGRAKHNMKSDRFFNRGERPRPHFREQATGRDFRRMNCNPRRRAM